MRIIRHHLRPPTPVRFPHRPVEPVMVEGNELQVINYGIHAYRSMIRAIDRAEESIYFSTFIFKGDRIGRLFKKHLLQKARQGVKVYVVYDGFANLLLLPFSFRYFPEPLVLRVYSPLYSFLNFLWPPSYVRYHRKLLIVDGRVAFLGGLNIGQEYATRWRIAHLRIEGPFAEDVREAYARMWNKHNRFNKSLKINLQPQSQASAQTTLPESSCWQLALRESFSPFESSSDRPDQIRQSYRQAIREAKDRIYLTNPYFLPDQATLALLLEALKRGVRVELVVPEKSNHRIVDLHARNYYKRLVKAGASVWLYQKTMIHAKTGVIDGKWVTIGSANLDNLSLINCELNLFVRNNAFASEMEKLFELDKLNCRAADLASLEYPSKLARILEFVTHPLLGYL
ncbi:MAG TPA: phosphatidylserine/phosphatidylglycerophosphate/cardiolipin synthase family protein [Chloroflexia bacterium]|nr:phosphatidylserine/phosphatidylglycerophosphate/cardiolipin synthase family protein [Chloroflexia bacterium]